MKPLLAHIYEPHRVSYPCYVQPKLNGVRALYQDGCFQSRDGIPWNSTVLRHLWEPLKSVFDPSIVLDGELYVHGWPLQRINGAVTPVRNAPNEDTIRVEYHIFDVVSFTKPFIERIKILPREVCQVSTFEALSAGHVDFYYNEFVKSGYEGLIYRLGDCPYTLPKQINPQRTRLKYLSDQNNRVWHLLKRKDWQDDEFEIISVEEGEGKRSNMVGALVMKTRAGKVFKTGTGLSDGEAIEYFQNPPLGRFAKIKFLVYSDEGIPMNSSIIAIL